MKRILSLLLAILVCCMSFVSVLGVSAEDVVVDEDVTTEEEVVETPASVNFFAASAPSGGDGSTWAQNAVGHAISQAWGLSMSDGNEDYYAGWTFLSKHIRFRSGWNGHAGPDITGMKWMKLTMKVAKPEDKGSVALTSDEFDSLISYWRNGNITDIDDGTVISTAYHMADSLKKQKIEILAGNYVDVIIPLSETATGEVKNMEIPVTDQWQNALNLDAKIYVKSIDFANESFANTYWEHSLPANLPIGLNVFNPPNDNADHGSGDTVQYGGWGQIVKSGCSIAMPAPADKLVVHWADARSVRFEKDWGSYDLTGYDRLAIKLKFNSAEMAYHGINFLNQNTDGVFATVYGDINSPSAPVATASYENFKTAFLAKSAELLAADKYVTIVVPFNAALEGSLKNVTVSTAFGIQWKEGLQLHIASVDLINYQYYDRYIDVAPENINVKFEDGPDFKTVSNAWDPQLTLDAKEDIITNKKITSVTFDLEIPEAELLRANMVYGSKGGGATFDDMAYGGADFAIYFTGTNVSRVGITQGEFYAALDENMADLKAGKKVTLTFDLAGEFVNGGTITGIKMMVANAGKPCDLSVFDGADISISHFYFNFNEEAFEDYDYADLDLDGNVTATDYTMLKKVLFDTELEIDNFNYGDVNGDNAIDILDYIAVYNTALYADE